MNEIKIHDIKGLVEIPDISLYFYMALWILGIAFLFVIIFFIFKYFYNKNRNEKKKYYKILKDLDFESNNAKQSAYTISKYSRLLVTNPREEKLCEELIDVLENYKYKKEVEPLNDEVKIVFGRFMDNIDV